ncbi:adhesin/hemagglutinin, HecA family protein [Pseudomonas sp. ATCC 13867]|nr:adhesin/hemagglutinin, HecA family protein [Pseudomonas sp. ATCC 13867]RFQ17415.1 hypothetical protein D0N87_26130 [Pseudomonas sp. ATCC 13867]
MHQLGTYCHFDSESIHHGQLTQQLHSWTRFAGAQLTQGALTGVANEALGQGSFNDALQGTLYNILQGSALDRKGDRFIFPTLISANVKVTKYHL